MLKHRVYLDDGSIVNLEGMNMSYDMDLNMVIFANQQKEIRFSMGRVMSVVEERVDNEEELFNDKGVT